MKKILIFAFLSFFMVSCSDSSNAAKSKKPQMPPMPVNVLAVKSANLPIDLEFSGVTKSDLEVVLKAQVAGTLEEKHFYAGQKVKKGEILYKIDPARYLANFNSAKANYQNAKANYQRAEKLRAVNAISPREFDQAMANYKSTQANLESARIDLNHSYLKAPFDGILGQTKQDVGSFVGIGSELVRISKIDPIYVEFGIADTQKLQINENLYSQKWGRLDSPVKIKISGKDYNGSLTFIDNIVDPNTATVQAKAKFDNKNLEIIPGIYTRIKVSNFYQKDGFKIPLLAVMQGVAKSYVYLAVDNKVVKKEVKIISQDAKTAIVSEGLKNGDLLILNNFKKIRPGAPIQVMKG